MGSQDEHRFDERRFLGLGVAVCLFGALTPLIDLALPRDFGALDIVGDLVSIFALYLYVGLAFGLTALRAGPVPKVAALLLLVDMLGPSVVVVLDVPHGSEALLVIHVLAVLAFAAALTPRRAPLDLALAASAVGGAALLAWAGFEGDEALRSVGLIITGLGLAGLFYLASRADPQRSEGAGLAANPVTDGHRADLGLRLIALGELGRLVLLAILFVGNVAARAAGASEAMSWIALSGHLVIIAMAAVGFHTMRDVRLGRVWVMAGLGLALLALGSALLELLAMGLGLDASFVGMPVTGRQIAHLSFAALAALSLGAIGERGGLDDARREARAVARIYLGLFALAYTTLLLRDFGGAKPLVSILGLVLIGVMVVAVQRFRALSDNVRRALPAVAASEAFGQAAPTTEGEGREG